MDKKIEIVDVCYTKHFFLEGNICLFMSGTRLVTSKVIGLLAWEDAVILKATLQFVCLS